MYFFAQKLLVVAHSTNLPPETAREGVILGHTNAQKLKVNTWVLAYIFSINGGVAGGWRGMRCHSFYLRAQWTYLCCPLSAFETHGTWEGGCLPM